MTLLYCLENTKKHVLPGVTMQLSLLKKNSNTVNFDLNDIYSDLTNSQIYFPLDNTYKHHFITKEGVLFRVAIPVNR